MANMSYCRFQNTLQDLWDCMEHITDTDLSAEERHARSRLVELCVGIIDEYDANDMEDVDEGLDEDEEDDRVGSADGSGEPR